MAVEDAIGRYIGTQPPARREALQTLNSRILKISPDARLWFLDGRNDEGRVISNPSIGYGETTLRQAAGKSREFYRVGLSANSSGLSCYVMGLSDRTYLAKTYGHRLGKAKVTGYCISFTSLQAVDLTVLEEIFADALGPGSEGAEP